MSPPTPSSSSSPAHTAGTPAQTPSAPPAAPSAASPSTARIIPIGTAVNYGDLFGSDPRYAQTLTDHFDAITPEWDMKWDHTEPQPGQWNFGPADAVVDYALAHGMSVHGHCLVWSQELPSWVTDGDWTKASLEAVLKQHIQTEVSHFAGRVHEWDVVNEPFNNDGSYTDNVFLRVIGPDYVSLALQWAHEADPSATLFLNDYNIDWPGPKEQAMLTLARQLLADGVPLGGIGMEEHLSLSWAPSPTQLADAMSDFASLGLKLEITESDVDTTGFDGTPAQRITAEAGVFGELASACRAQPACTRFTVWGVSDAVSWLGAAADGLPFDADYTATPSWQAILDGLVNPASR